MKSALPPFPFLKQLGVGHLLLLTDLDGTLAPFADTPQEATIPIETTRVLRQLAEKTTVTLGVVSGRPLSDVKRLVGIPGIWYAGLHGHEWEMDEIHGNITVERTDSTDQLLRDLIPLTERFPQMLLEEKGISIGIHYRRLPADRKAEFTRQVHEIIDPYLRNGRMTLQEGSKVYELFEYHTWHKGTFVSLAMDMVNKDHPGSTLFYIGDDTTDEDVFGAFPRAFTVKVGPGETRARFRIPSVTDVRAVLEYLSSVSS